MINFAHIIFTILLSFGLYINVTAEIRWRISSQTLAFPIVSSSKLNGSVIWNNGMLYVDQPIRLEIIEPILSTSEVNSEDIHWTIPERCTNLTPENMLIGVTANFVCKTNGNTKIQVSIGDAIYFIILDIKPSIGRYRWNLSIFQENTTQSQMEVVSNTDCQLRIWIHLLDDDATSLEKMNMHFTSVEADIAQQYYSMGEYPSITVSSQVFIPILDKETLTTIPLSFDLDQKFWYWNFIAEIPDSGMDSLMHIEVFGQGVSIMNKYLPNQYFVLPVRKEVLKESTDDVTGSTISTRIPIEIEIIRNYCGSKPIFAKIKTLDQESSKESSILLQLDSGTSNKVKVLHTHADFNSFAVISPSLLSTSSSFSNTNSALNISVWSSNDKNYALKSMIFTISSTDSDNTLNSTRVGCTTTSTDGGECELKTAEFCSNFQNTQINNQLVAWKSNMKSRSFYASINGGLTWVELMIMEALALDNYSNDNLSSFQIYSISPTIGRSTYLVLVSIDGPGTSEKLISVTLPFHTLLSLSSSGATSTGTSSSNNRKVLDMNVIELQSWTTAVLHKGGSDGGYLPVTSNPEIIISTHGTSEVFMWGDTLLYSPNGGITVLKVTLIKFNEIEYDLSAEDDYIKKVVVSEWGKIGVLTLHGRVFGGHSSSPKVFELHSGIRHTDISTITFNIHGQLQTVVASPTYPFVTIHPIIMNYPTRTCPHHDIQWIHHSNSSSSKSSNNINEGVDIDSYIDINESINISVTMRTPLVYDGISLTGYYGDQQQQYYNRHRLSPEGISASISDADILNIEVNHVISKSYDTFGIVKEITKEIIVAESKLVRSLSDRQERMEMIQGQQDLRISPFNSDVSCEYNRILTRIKAGCPTNRHLRVRYDTVAMDMCPYKPSPNMPTKMCRLASCYEDCYCSKFRQNYPYIIKKESFHSNSNNDDNNNIISETLENDLLQTYDYAKYGCPIRRHHEAAYLPVLELWDGDIFIKHIETDFVLKEMNNRHDFSYSLNANQAGCRKLPLSWNTQISKYQKGENSWTPLNHESCWDGDNDNNNNNDYTDDDILESTVYEIINSTNGNSIKFDSYTLDGLFIFEARIVDPVSSYCELKVSFAIELFGSPLAVSGALVTFSLCSLVIISFLLLSFWWYNKK